MTFQPVVPISGIAGYLFMQRTQATQQEVFNKSPQIARDVAYFKDNIANATTAEALVSDYRFRGISQSNTNPAVQGGFDVAFDNGFYLDPQVPR